MVSISISERVHMWIVWLQFKVGEHFFFLAQHSLLILLIRSVLCSWGSGGEVSCDLFVSGSLIQLRYPRNPAFVCGVFLYCL